MRVLLVEDEEATARQIQELLESECQAVVEVVFSRDSALRVLERDEDLDLIVCDLRIPTQDGALDIAEEHGLRVHDAARDMHSGTFSRFFSGFARLENIGERLASGPSVDVFGTGQSWPLVHWFPKSHQPEFVDWVKQLSMILENVDQLAIRHPGVTFKSNCEARALRIYATRLNGSQIHASLLGGLSGATVLRVDIINEASASVGLVVAKVGYIHSIQDELYRYNMYVAPVLSIGTFAPLAGEVLHGCGRFGAAFYKLASNGYTNLFELSMADESTSQISLEQLHMSHEHWRGNRTIRDRSVRSLRAAHISDEALTPWIEELDLNRVERTEAIDVSLVYSIQHGDLHGLNVLVDGEGRPLIIDYGTLGQHPVAFDPVTLELSFIFHDQHPELGGWPSVEQASRWFDTDHYAAGSPIGGIVDSCRRWALSVATRRELAVVVYAHATRQLKYADTDKSLAVAIARAAMAVLIDE